MVFRRKITPNNPTKNSRLETMINSLIPIVINILEIYFPVSVDVDCFLLMTMTPIMATRRRKPMT